MLIKTPPTTSPFFTKYGIYIALVIAFVPALITVVTRAYGPVENYGWNILYYHVGYETGFGGRKLLATICHWFFPDFVRLRHIRTMVISVNIIMVALFILFVGKCIKSTKSYSIWLVIILYALGPFSIISFMKSGLSVAFTETYQITLTLLWLLLWMKYRGYWSFYIATIIIASICCLQHHTFCCTLFPLYVALFAYDVIEHDQIQIRKAIGYGFVCIVLLGLLVVIWRFSTMNIDIDQLNEWFKTHVAVDAYECSREAHEAYYYQTNTENRANISYLLTWRNRYVELFLSVILLSPLLTVVYYPWIRASHFAKSRIIAWRYRLVWITLTVLTLPVFFMATDYNRWFVCYFFGMFVITAIIIAIGDRPLCTATTRLYTWFIKHPFIGTSLTIYLICLHCAPFNQTISHYGLQEAIYLWSLIMGILY